MDVKYYCDGELIYETHTSDLSGLMMAIEKSNSIHFEDDAYTFDAFFLTIMNKTEYGMRNWWFIWSSKANAEGYAKYQKTHEIATSCV